MDKKVTFNNIHEGAVNERKSIVVSECSEGGYSVAVMKKVADNNNPDKTVKIPMKGTIRAKDKAELVAIANAITDSLDKIPDDSDNDNW